MEYLYIFVSLPKPRSANPQVCNTTVQDTLEILTSQLESGAELLVAYVVHRHQGRKNNLVAITSKISACTRLDK